MEMLQDISQNFTMEKYHVFNNNCNNFTDECASLLLGTGIPKDIVDLPREFLNTPLGQQFAPMMQNMQNSLQVSSNSLFNDSGQQ